MLENIEIIDYKCFKDFKLNGLGQINIISGGNNVGKTALLEVLFLENYINNTVNNLHDITLPLSVIAKNRDIKFGNIKTYLKTLNFKLKKDSNEISVEHKYPNNLNKKELLILEESIPDSQGFLVQNIDNNVKLQPISYVREKSNLTNYINSSKPTSNKLIKLYSTIQTKGIQSKFLKYVRILDENIELIEPQMLNDELYLRLTLNHPKITLTSSELGEGTNRYIEILATLLSNSKGSVFIDEIENGIHYSKLKEIFKAIIEIVLKEDIQLFITTHDSESIEALVEASKELNYKDITSIYLYNKDEKVEATIRDSENLIYGINRGADIR